LRSLSLNTIILVFVGLCQYYCHCCSHETTRF